jgi:arylsulfatase A-like enzyme
LTAPKVARQKEDCLVRDSLVDATECALVYGGITNVLAFVVPLFHRSTDASLAFAVLTQVVLLVTMLAVTVAVGGMVQLKRRLAPSAVGPPSSFRHLGAATLGAIGLFASYELHEPVLMAAAFLVFALLIATHVVEHGGTGRRVERAWGNWRAAVILAVVPFLAQPRAERGWPPLLALSAAAAVVALAFWPVILSKRQFTVRPTHPWLRFASLALLCTAGCMPGMLAEETEPVLPTTSASAPASPHRPNVIVVTLDTVRADHLSVYGYPQDTTPNLRTWWRQGATRYTRAFATSDMTLASHASIFTGLLPSEHGAHRRGPRPDTGLRPSADTLAIRLHQAGFVTAGIAANAAYLSPRFGFNAGFDYYDARRPPRLTAPSPSYFFGGTLLYWLLAYAGPDFQFSYRSATQITNQALELVPQLKATGRPFFLFLNMMDAHTPMVAPPAYRHAFGVRDDGFYWVRDYAQLVKEINSGMRTITNQERTNLIASYDAAIAYLDAELGRLLTTLAAVGVLDDSVIVITSDHGELFGHSGAVGHDGVGIVPGVFHVPLLIRFPGSREARNDRRAVSSIDLYPTILELCGLSGGLSPHARNLQSSAAWPQRPLLFESFESSWLAALHPRFRGDQRGVLIDGQLIRIGREDRPTRASWTRNRAARSATDNLTSSLEEEAYSALRELEQAAVIDQGTPPQDGPLDRLRSLGYVMQ